MPQRRILFSLIVSTLFLFLLIFSSTFAELVNDGSFESNPSAWEEFFNTTPCNSIGNWSQVAGAPNAFDGQQSLWVGGVCNNSVRNNGVRQTFALQEDVALLSFWFNPIKSVPDVLNIDQAFVSINETDIWTLGVDGITNPTGWNNALVDISQFADQTATLSLEIQQNNDASTANVFFDYIEFLHPSVEIDQAFIPAAVLSGESFSVEVTVVNSGDTILNNIFVNNSSFSNCDRAVGTLPDLAPGESTTYTCQVTNASSEMENTASVQAITTEIDYLVEANQTVSAPVVNPRLSLVITPDDISVEEGEQLSLNFALTNSGNAALTNVEISALETAVCSFSLDPLPVGETAVFNCTFTPNHSGIITFLATAIEPITGSEAVVNTAVTIEVVPVEPPSIAIYDLYLPAVTNNLINHNALGEPNNVCDLAFPVTKNQQSEFLAEDINDWYRFSLNSTSNLTVNLTNFVPIAGQITLWSGNCGGLTLIGQNGDFSATKSITLQNQPPGNYYAWLINDGPTNNVDKYSLIIEAP